jgi:hypothetical protein
MRILHIVLTALSTSAINPAAAVGPDDFFGLWKQSFERSGGYQPAGVTSAGLRIEKAGDDTVKLTFEEMVSGKKAGDERVFKLDGSVFKDGDSDRMYRRVSPTVWTWSSKSQSRETNGFMILSQDGKSLYMTADMKRQNGQRRQYIRVFEKQ